MELKTKDELSVWYDYQPGEKTCIVFLHGFTGSSSAFKPISSFFKKKGYGTLLVDIRGHGLSDKPRDKSRYMISLAAEDIKEILDFHSIKKVIFVGHCYGCLVSMEFYKKYPEYVEKIVFISTGYDFTKKDIRYLSSLIVFFLYNITALLTFPLGLEKNRIHLDYSVFKRSSDFDLKRIYWDIRVTSLRTILPFFQEIISLNYEKTLAGMDIPVLVIHGKYDKVIPKDNAQKINLLVKNSKLNIINSNHLPVLNSIPKIKSLVYSFIK